VANFTYQIVRKKGFGSNASISVSAGKGVVVRAPFWMPKGVIDRFIQEKTEWIEKHLKTIKQNKVVKNYSEGEKHLYFGKEYSLSITKVKKPGRSKVCLTDEKIYIELYEGLSEDKHSKLIEESLLYWYLEKGIETVTEKVNFYSKEIGVSYRKINLKKVSSIWGSCSPSNCLSFNRKLIMAPHEVVDYVVIHEVAHMVHRNHGSEFWNLVKKYDPDYKYHRRWLKHNHHLLSI